MKNTVIPQNFLTRKLGKITVFFAVKPNYVTFQYTFLGFTDINS